MTAAATVFLYVAAALDPLLGSTTAEGACRVGLGSLPPK